MPYEDVVVMLFVLVSLTRVEFGVAVSVGLGSIVFGSASLESPDGAKVGVFSPVGIVEFVHDSSRFVDVMCDIVSIY